MMRKMDALRAPGGAGCAAAMDASQLGRRGIISAGDITVRVS